MMQSCGGCSANDIGLVAQVLANPVTWLMLGTALVTMLPKKNQKDKK